MEIGMISSELKTHFRWIRLVNQFTRNLKRKQ